MRAIGLLARAGYGPLALAGFIGTVFAANYAIEHIGRCGPGGPCTVPVLPGIDAPSGVLFIGLAFVLRDIVHERYGAAGALVAICAGALLSWWISPALAAASAAAFLLSETADLVVYAPLRRRHLLLAGPASNVVGAVADSIVFLLLAFGSLAFIEGQVVGKLLMSTAGLALLWVARRSPRLQAEALS